MDGASILEFDGPLAGGLLDPIGKHLFHINVEVLSLSSLKPDCLSWRLVGSLDCLEEPIPGSW